MTNRLAPAIVVTQLFWGAGALASASGDRLILTAPENSVDTVIGEVIVREAYRRIGINVVIKKYPAERAMRLANQGDIDGEIQRIDGLSEKYPNLVKVTPSINFLEAAVFSKTTDFEVDGWNSLRPYRIGIIQGIKFAENNTRGMTVAPVNNYETLFRILERERIDIAVSPRVNGWYQVRRMGLKGIHSLKPRVAIFSLFHYLHRKNADLVPRISAVFSRMWASGELPRIRMHVISIMLERAEQRLPICDDDYACFETPGDED